MYHCALSKSVAHLSLLAIRNLNDVAIIEQLSVAHLSLLAIRNSRYGCSNNILSVAHLSLLAIRNVDRYTSSIE